METSRLKKFARYARFTLMGIRIFKDLPRNGKGRTGTMPTFSNGVLLEVLGQVLS